MFLPVEVLVDCCGAGGAYYSGELREGGLLDFAHTLEVLEQGVAALLADAIYAIQLACYECVVALLAVEGDAEAVCLIADVADNLQWLTRAREIVGYGVAWVEDLLEALGETHDGYLAIYAQLLEYCVGTRELTLAAIDDDEVGKLCTLGKEA